MVRGLIAASSLLLATAACIFGNPSGGVVQGVVYADLNGDGNIDANEGPLEGVDVQLSGCGSTLTTTTGADGAFSFTGLPAGSCLVQVSKTGWTFSGSYPSLGYPIPVASDPSLPTSFSVYMTPTTQDQPAGVPATNCTNLLDVVYENPLQKAHMPPGQSFTKLWTVLNQGTCAWDEGYHLIFEGGPSPSQGASPMGSPMDIPLASLVPVPVLPGQQVTLALSLTAPQQPGWYVGSWKLVAPNGEAMPTVCLCTDIVVEADAPPLSTSSISGLVWHDLCALPDGPLPPSAPPGCVPYGGTYEANGSLDPGEPGLANVTIRLGAGPCPAFGLATALSATDGSFAFSGLAPGAYCVSVGALVDGNDSILIPGGWTHPVAHADPQEVDIVLAPGQDEGGVDFGWDYQFLPAWVEPAPPETEAPGGFGPPQASAETFYYRGLGCGPKEVRLTVEALDPGVRNVVLFFRLKGQDGQTTAWNDGVAMDPQGNGFFASTLVAETIPDFAMFTKAFLQYQFVAEGTEGQVLSRSPVYGDIMLEVCSR